MALEPMSIVATIRTVLDLGRKIGDIPLNNQIIELQSQVMEMLAQNTDLVQKNFALQTKVTELEGKLADDGLIEFSGNCYWRWDGANWEGPFCAKCKGSDGKMVRMGQYPSNNYYSARYLCSVCAFESRVDRTTPPKEPPPK